VSKLSLVRFVPDLDRLARAAAARRLVGIGGDFGYPLHAALAAAFGDMAPKPFLLRAEIRQPEVLGYTRADPAEIRETIRLPAIDLTDLIKPLRLDGIEVRELPPDWTAGRRLDFETRVRPVVRTRPQGRDGPTRERDAFLETLDDGEPPATSAAPHRAWPLRESAYTQWLARELGRGNAARLELARLVTFRRTRVLRRPMRPGEGRRRVEGEGPDAVLRGRLQIEDGDGFARLLARGIGRHRAFGFGMLLLIPPGRLVAGR
jgi:CRISPR system Cascade subunit CasE